MIRDIKMKRQGENLVNLEEIVGSPGDEFRVLVELPSGKGWQIVGQITFEQLFEDVRSSSAGVA